MPPWCLTTIKFYLLFFFNKLLTPLVHALTTFSLRIVKIIMFNVQYLRCRLPITIVSHLISHLVSTKIVHCQEFLNNLLIKKDLRVRCRSKFGKVFCMGIMLIFVRTRSILLSNLQLEVLQNMLNRGIGVCPWNLG